MTLAVGAKAPDATLPTQTGAEITLSALWQKGPVVLYFYPKDETPGCTAEACSFRDNFEVFKEAGAEVVGASSDSVESHRQFAEHHRLPFTLLSDKGSALAKSYGVGKTLGLLPGRVTFIIDRSGTIRHVFNSQLQAKKHVSEALSVLKSL
jgi:peroxiredoxin Q/BCP